ncbi:MAG: ATP-binding protein [Deltaproteobacteria bacterium]|nr:ATP-binding protein [Deltaproteobacteria bacterium]
MVDYKEGIKKEVAEIKFLIHDLRVERFINEVLHYHVTVNTDLEIYSVDQAQVLHGEDLQELKDKAVGMRRAYQDYSNAVKNFSPDKTVLVTGKRYIEAIHDICELILNPLWGRIDRVLSFLPRDSHSYQSRSHYRNCIRWIGGVQYRIQGFLDERDDKVLHEPFDVAAELDDFTHNVVVGYVIEKSNARVELRVDRLDAAVLEGNRHRFRRMYFNLVMNSVDAMAHRRVGMVRVGLTVEGDDVVLRVRDNGVGMSAERIRELMTDKESLDGELHSLGFVFVRQTVADFGGQLAIESKPGEGTAVTVRIPRVVDAPPPPPRPSPWERFNIKWGDDGLLPLPVSSGTDTPLPAVRHSANGAGEKRYGELVLQDYRGSEADHPGSIFHIAVTEDDRVELFTHRPYERHWNITHEDLSPVYYQATVRGRLEDDEEKRPVLILKAPQSMPEYFELKGVPGTERTAERFVQMVHDEYVRVARKLVATGLSAQTPVFMTDAARLFPDKPEVFQQEPIPLALLAGQEVLR